VKANVRVIAATHQDLEQRVKEGNFREDLFHRLNVVQMRLPPLRERAEDISELATHFVQKFCAPGGRTLGISENALRLLERYSWPGNVRELEHTIERAVALESTGSIEPERLPEKITNYNPYRVAEAMEFPEEGINLTAHLDQLEKTYVLEALQRTSGNQTNAAELLRLSVRSLRHLLDKHGVRGLTAQMRDERRGPESTPRRRATDQGPRRRAEDTGEFAAGVGDGN
jgi:two-component system response regulator PilR (NtrC family)